MNLEGATEVSLEKAAYHYKLYAENGQSIAYSELARCYRKMRGEENKKKADAYMKMVDVR